MKTESKTTGEAIECACVHPDARECAHIRDRKAESVEIGFFCEPVHTFARLCECCCHKRQEDEDDNENWDNI